MMDDDNDKIANQVLGIISEMLTELLQITVSHGQSIAVFFQNVITETDKIGPTWSLSDFL